MTNSATAELETVPLSRLISAIVHRISPFETPAATPRKPAAPQEYLPTRRLASSLTTSSIGTTLASKSGARGTITSLARFVQDGSVFIQIIATGGASLSCRADTEVVTWAWGTPRQPPVRSTPADVAHRIARREMIVTAYQERLAEDAKHSAATVQPRILTGYFAGMVA